MIGLIIRPDRKIETVKARNPEMLVHKRAIYSIEPEAIRKLNGKKVGKPGEKKTPVCVWVYGNPVPVGTKNAERSFKRIATDVWLTRTLEQLAAPRMRLPGKYIMWFIIILVILGVMFSG